MSYLHSIIQNGFQSGKSNILNSREPLVTVKDHISSSNTVRSERSCKPRMDCTIFQCIATCDIQLKQCQDSNFPELLPSAIASRHRKMFSNYNLNLKQAEVSVIWPADRRAVQLFPESRVRIPRTLKALDFPLRL